MRKKMVLFWFALFGLVFFLNPVEAMIESQQTQRNEQNEKAMVVLGELHKRDIMVTSMPDKIVGGQVRYQNGKPFIMVSSSYPQEQEKRLVHEATHILARQHSLLRQKNGSVSSLMEIMSQVYEKRNPQQFKVYKEAPKGSPYNYGDYNKLVRPTEALALYAEKHYQGNIPNNQRIPVFDRVLKESGLGVLLKKE